MKKIIYKHELFLHELILQARLARLIPRIAKYHYPCDMKIRNSTIELDASSGLPKEILVLKIGKTDTTQGPYYLDKEHAKEVMTTYMKRGTKLFIDFNHASLNPKSPEDGIAAAWFDLDMKEEGIRMTNIKWTDRGAEYLKKKEYRYLSPVIKLDKNDYVTRLVNVALTNLPSTDNLEPLTELSESMMREEQLEMDIEEILRLLC